jgi:hypothetical protein
MSNPIQTEYPSNLVAEKLRNAIQELSLKLSSPNGISVPAAISETMASIRDYILFIGSSEFDPEFLTTNDTPRSEAYNDNLRKIHNDLKRFYEDLRNLNDAQISSYNYAQVVTEEIISRADELASTVLDLNILNNFDRGDILVAGDDFKNTNSLDSSVGLASPQAELLLNGEGLTLARVSTSVVTDMDTKIEIIPLSPVSSNSSSESVVTSPTPSNLERFYEGNYYNFLGLARPEGGGDFNFKYILSPNVTLSPAASPGGNAFNPIIFGTTANVPGPTAENAPAPFGDPEDVFVYIELGADAEKKEAVRKRMLDSNPTTFWEAEYLYKISSPLLNVGQPTVGSNPAGQEVTIDLESAERIAKNFDTLGRDLIIDIVLTFPRVVSINVATINPIIFGTTAFPEILDVSTANVETGEFETVDGWDSIRFARVITPEANEFLTESQAGLLLAPSKGAYKGQAVFPFPQRETTKLRFRIKMDNPVPAPYERIYVLLKNDIETTTTVRTTTKRGLVG